jgi:hypothetical protein
MEIAGPSSIISREITTYSMRKIKNGSLKAMWVFTIQELWLREL